MRIFPGMYCLFFWPNLFISDIGAIYNVCRYNWLVFQENITRGCLFLRREKVKALNLHQTVVKQVGYRTKQTHIVFRIGCTGSYYNDNCRCSDEIFDEITTFPLQCCPRNIHQSLAINYPKFALHVIMLYICYITCRFISYFRITVLHICIAFLNTDRKTGWSTFRGRHTEMHS